MSSAALASCAGYRYLHDKTARTADAEWYIVSADILLCLTM
jgi:hypothetical protein